MVVRLGWFKFIENPPNFQELTFFSICQKMAELFLFYCFFFWLTLQSLEEKLNEETNVVWIHLIFRSEIYSPWFASKPQWISIFLELFWWTEMTSRTNTYHMYTNRIIVPFFPKFFFPPMCKRSIKTQLYQRSNKYSDWVPVVKVSGMQNRQQWGM